jgi:hypothetical protein
MGDISKEVANTIKPDKKYTKKQFKQLKKERKIKDLPQNAGFIFA